jgi:hypothetical protein
VRPSVQTPLPKKEKKPSYDRDTHISWKGWLAVSAMKPLSTENRIPNFWVSCESCEYKFTEYWSHI